MYPNEHPNIMGEVETTAPGQSPRKQFDPSLMTVSKEKLQRGLLEGRYSTDEVKQIVFKSKYEQMGLLDLDAEDVQTGLVTGELSKQQAQSWMDHKTNAPMFWTKELLWTAPKHGIRTAIDNAQSLFDEAVAMLTPNDVEGMNAMLAQGGDYSAPVTSGTTDKQQKEAIQSAVPHLPEVDKPVTGISDVESKIINFATGFIPGMGVTKAGMAKSGLTYLKAGTTTEGRAALIAAKDAKLINTTIADFALAHPKLSYSTGYLLENYGAGALTDFTVWGPDQERLADWLVHFPWAKDTIIDYLATDPNDGFMEARLKNALEGGLTGLVAEPVIQMFRYILKGAKGSIWTHAGHDRETVTDIATDLRAKMAASEQKVQPEFAGVKYETKLKPGTPDETLPFVREPEAMLKSADEAEVRALYDSLPEADRAGLEIRNDGMNFILADKAWFQHNDIKALAKAGTEEAELYERLIRGEAINPLQLQKYPRLRELVEGVMAGKNRIPSDMGLDAYTPYHQNKMVDMITTMLAGGRNIAKEGGEPFQNWGKLVTSPGFTEAFDTALKKLTKGENKYGAVNAHMTFEQIEKLGFFYNMDPKRIAQLNAEMSGFASKLSRMQDVLSDYSAYVDDLVNRALKSDNMGLAAEAVEHMKTLADMYINAKGVKSAMGRNLATLKMIKRGNALNGAEWAQQWGEQMKVNGQDARLLLKKYVANKDVRNKLQYAKTLEMNQPVLEALLELEQASLVSGLTTNFFNVMGQGVATVFEGIARSLAITYMGKKMGAEYVREALSTQWMGYMFGLRAAIGMPDKFWKEASIWSPRKAWQMINLDDGQQGNVYRAFKAGQSVLDPLTRFEGTDISALKYVAGKTGSFVGGDVGEKVGKGVAEAATATFRPLAAADEFFRTVNFYSHQHIAMFEKAWASGARGGDLEQMVKYMVHNPTVVSINDALKRSRDVTLNSNMPKFFEKLNQAVLELPLGAGLLVKTLVMPFVKVPANIARYQLEMGPGGAIARFVAATGGDIETIRKLSGRFAEDYASGGIRRQEAIARVYLGTSLTALGAVMYLNGNMSSGLRPSERGTAEVAGLKGNAIQAGGYQIPLERYAPIASLLIMGANFARLASSITEAAKGEVEWETALKLWPLLADSLMSQVSLRDINAVISTIADDRPMSLDRLNQSVGRKIEALTPFSGLGKNLSMWFGDGEKKKIWNWYEGFYSAWFRDNLEAQRHSVYGHELENTPYLYSGPEQRDEMMTELFALGVDIKPMDRKVKAGMQELELSPEEYNRVHDILASQNVKEDLLRTRAQLEGVNDEQIRAQAYSSVIAGHRKAAVGKFLRERPDKVQQFREGGARINDAARGGEVRHDPKKYTGQKPWLNELIEQ